MISKFLACYSLRLLTASCAERYVVSLAVQKSVIHGHRSSTTATSSWYSHFSRRHGASLFGEKKNVASRASEALHAIDFVVTGLHLTRNESVLLHDRDHSLAVVAPTVDMTLVAPSRNNMKLVTVLACMLLVFNFFELNCLTCVDQTAPERRHMVTLVHLICSSLIL